MSLKDDLLTKARQFYRDWLPIETSPQFTINQLGQPEKTIQPYKLIIAIDMERNFVTFGVTTLKPNETIIFTIPHLIHQTLLNLRQGKLGTGNLLIEDPNFSSKETGYNNQVHIFTDECLFDKEKIKNEFKKVGLRLTINEYGDSVQFEKRSALLIGIGDYKQITKLRNPINDATDMKEKLESLGFNTSISINPDYRQFKKAIDQFTSALQETDASLIYFAGHGIQSNGINYLVPTDANCHTEAELEYECIQADSIISKLQRSQTCKTNILILDACRDNPFSSFNRSFSNSGLAPMNAPEGTFIAYATSPGKTASDGEDSNGLYTSKLLKHISQRALTIEEIFKLVRRDVKDKSNNTQIPWETTSLVGKFYFH